MRGAIKIFLIFFVLISPGCAFAMQSDNYSIMVDSVDSGGGSNDSANFSILDSAGESFVGVGSSEDFGVSAGFESEANFGISLAIDSSINDLENIIPGNNMIGDTSVSVTTDAWDGYDMAIFQDNDLTHTDGVTTISNYACPIASPCLWAGTGLGFTINSGTDVDAKWFDNPNYYYASIPDVVTVIHVKEGYASGEDITNIEYKIDVPATQKSGRYTNSVSYVVTARI
jgi:hypothetical protein